MTATTTQQTTIIPQGKGQWLVSSKSQPDTQHVVKRTTTGQLQCSCDGAYFTGRCYHTGLVLDLLTSATDARISALVAERNPLMRSA